MVLERLEEARLQLVSNARENLRSIITRGYQGTLCLGGPEAVSGWLPRYGLSFILYGDGLRYTLNGGQLFERTYDACGRPTGFVPTDVDKIPFEDYPLSILKQTAEEIENVLKIQRPPTV